MKSTREHGEDSGFTLIELLIIMVILAVLAGIVVFAVQNLSGQSAGSSCQSDYKTVETAAEAYRAQMFVYPSNIAQLTSTATQPESGRTVGPWLRDLPVTNHYNLVINTGDVFGDTAFNSSNLNLGLDGVLYVVTKNGTGADTATPQWSNDANVGLYASLGTKAYGDTNTPNVSPAAPSYTKPGGVYTLGTYTQDSAAIACANVASAVEAGG